MIRALEIHDVDNRSEAEIGRSSDQLIPERSRNRGLANRSEAEMGRHGDQLISA